jgi:tetratricopeptide (TPR) repeat protein
MQLKLFPTAALVTALLLISATDGAAQVTQISGKVTLRQADGSVVPVQGAYVDIYRTDVRQEFHVKTDKKGQYQHAGIPFVGTYTFAVSAPGARPDYRAGVRVSQQQEYNFELEPGDGSRLTLEQIVGDSAEARAARAEFERKTREIDEGNRKITATNEIISRTFRDGNAALNAGRVEEAIAQYREGLAARPDEPALLANLSYALRQRGDERYNAALKSSPPDATGVDAAKKDWQESAASSDRALEVIDTALTSSAADPQTQQIYNSNKLVALSTRALALQRIATKVDNTQASAAWEANQEYIAVETDPAKKAKSRGEALQMLFDASATDLAIEEARTVLDEEPNDLTANRVLGLSLLASGDKENYQEAADRLQQYVDLAPDTDPLKRYAKEALELLMREENIKPRRR